jgi:hypothetical protein
MEFSYLPLPHAALYRVRLIVPDALAASAEAVYAYPAMLPLLSGRVRLASVHLASPEVEAKLAEPAAGEEVPPGASSFQGWEDALARILVRLGRGTKDLEVRVDRGRLRLWRGETPAHWFRDVDGGVQLSSGSLSLEISAQSDLWERLGLRGQIRLADLKGRARVDWGGLRAHALLAAFAPAVAERVKDSKVNLGLSLTINGLTEVRGELDGTSSHILVELHGERAHLRVKGLSGRFHLGADSLSLTVADLQLASPEMALSGELSLDRMGPKARLLVEGKGVEILPARKAAAVLLGGPPWLETLSGILRDGKLPRLHVSCEAGAVQDLCGTRTVVVRGSLREGTVRVPDTGLDLEAVRGDVAVAGGILEARGIEAQLTQLFAHGGELTVGLTGDDAPVRLDARVDADLAALQPALRGLLGNLAWAGEMDRIAEMRGHAVGRVVVEGTLKSPKWSVEAADFNLWMDYDRLPGDLEITSGGFAYGEGQIRIKDLAGAVGGSRFSGLAARVDLRGEPSLRVLDARGELSLEELYQWWKALGGDERTGDVVASVSGRGALAGLSLEGPLLQPEQWRFRAEGRLEGLTLKAAPLPAPLTLHHGAVEATQREAIIRSAALELLDTRLSAGQISLGYGAGGLTGELAAEGPVGPALWQWVLERIAPPSALSPRAPAALSDARLSWGRDAGWTFAGGLDMGEDRIVSLAASWDDTGARLEEVQIRDGRSDAHLSVAADRQQVQARFKGRLDQATVDGLLQTNRFFTGRLEGDLDITLTPADPLTLKAQGWLRGEDVHLSPWIALPLELRTFSVEAEGDGVFVHSASVAFGAQTLQVQGRLRPSSKGIEVDLSLETDHLQWEPWVPLLTGEFSVSPGMPSPAGAALRPQPAPLRGKLSIRADRLSAGGFSWEPLAVLLDLDGEEIRATILETGLCGVSVPGTVKVSSRGVSLDARPTSSGQPLQPLLACLLGGKVEATGTYDLDASLTAQGRAPELLQGTQGQAVLQARDGRIHHLAILSKVFAVLNVTEMYRGRLPDLSQAGAAYDSMTLKVSLKRGVLTVQEWTVAGPSLNVVCQGDMVLTKGTLNLKALVSVSRTMDAATRRIPVLRHLVGDAFLSVPVRITGKLEDPKVTVLSSKDVAAALLGLLKRTAEIPFVLVEPVMPGMDPKKESGPRGR